MAKKLLLVCFFFLCCRLGAFANFIYDANCIEAYKAIYSFRINEAKLLIQKEKEQNPQNGIIILLENYIDYFGLLASESKTDYDRLKDNKSLRVSELENNEKNSPYYLFSQAEVYLQWGLLKAKFGDYFSSSMDLKKAANLLRDNAQKYPDFLPNQKSIGLINVIFGAVPSNLKSVTRFLGMSGSVQGGVKQLEELRTTLPKTKYSFYKDEVLFFLCNIDIDILRNRNNYTKLASYLAGMENNGLLKVYLQGYVASKTGHSDETIDFLEAAPKSNQYLDMPAIYYLLGNAKLNRLDKDAPIFLNKYIKEYRGRNYIKDAYLKLAYFYLLENDVKRYDSSLKLVRSKGYTLDEKDQQALREANDDRPDTELLKARFYFDGGYYNKALAEIKNKDANNLKLLRDKIELYYRLARIYEKTDKLNDALANYQRAISLGKTSRYYYAANAAVRVGNIYEQKKDFNRAANFYNQAIDMKNHDYQTGIQNEAKEGLKRINR
jgi:tetratricopeptide (TPR) repeat protein